MAVANLYAWQQDPLFDAAEDVQDSADRLESTLRVWQHDAAEGTRHTGAEEMENRRLRLITACDTLRWQLEAFERVALRDSQLDSSSGSSSSAYGFCRPAGGLLGPAARERRQQFVNAIRAQLVAVEKEVVRGQRSEATSAAAAYASAADAPHSYISPAVGYGFSSLQVSTAATAVAARSMLLPGETGGVLPGWGGVGAKQLQEGWVAGSSSGMAGKSSSGVSNGFLADFFSSSGNSNGSSSNGSGSSSSLQDSLVDDRMPANHKQFSVSSRWSMMAEAATNGSAGLSLEVAAAAASRRHSSPFELVGGEGSALRENKASGCSIGGSSISSGSGVGSSSRGWQRTSGSVVGKAAADDVAIEEEARCTAAGACTEPMRCWTSPGSLSPSTASPSSSTTSPSSLQQANAVGSGGGGGDAVLLMEPGGHLIPFTPAPSMVSRGVVGGAGGGSGVNGLHGLRHSVRRLQGWQCLFFWVRHFPRGGLGGGQVFPCRQLDHPFEGGCGRQEVCCACGIGGGVCERFSEKGKEVDRRAQGSWCGGGDLEKCGGSGNSCSGGSGSIDSCSSSSSSGASSSSCANAGTDGCRLSSSGCLSAMGSSRRGREACGADYTGAPSHDCNGAAAMHSKRLVGHDDAHWLLSPPPLHHAAAAIARNMSCDDLLKATPPCRRHDLVLQGAGGGGGLPGVGPWHTQLKLLRKGGGCGGAAVRVQPHQHYRNTTMAWLLWLTCLALALAVGAYVACCSRGSMARRELQESGVLVP